MRKAGSPIPRRGFLPLRPFLRRFIFIEAESSPSGGGRDAGRDSASPRDGFDEGGGGLIRSGFASPGRVAVRRDADGARAARIFLVSTEFFIDN